MTNASLRCSMQEPFLREALEGAVTGSPHIFLSLVSTGELRSMPWEAVGAGRAAALLVKQHRPQESCTSYKGRENKGRTVVPKPLRGLCWLSGLNCSCLQSSCSSLSRNSLLCRTQAERCPTGLCVALSGDNMRIQSEV